MTKVLMKVKTGDDEGTKKMPLKAKRPVTMKVWKPIRQAEVEEGERWRRIRFKAWVRSALALLFPVLFMTR